MIIAQYQVVIDTAQAPETLKRVHDALGAPAVRCAPHRAVDAGPQTIPADLRKKLMDRIRTLGFDAAWNRQ